MEIDDIISALEKTLYFLHQSDSSDYAHLSAEELIKQIEFELDKIKNFGVIDKKQLSYLFAPTSSLQETSIDNGWGEEFLELSRYF